MTVELCWCCAQVLKQGLHARQLHSGMPAMTDGVKSLNHNSLDKGSRIPGAHVYFRVERASKVSVAALYMSYRSRQKI